MIKNQEVIQFFNENGDPTDIPKYNEKWFSFWIISLILFTFLIISIFNIIYIPLELYFPITNVLFISVLVFLFLSMKLVNGGHRFFKDVISHIGRIHQKNRSNPNRIIILDNRKAAVLFFIFCMNFAGIAIFFGSLLYNYHNTIDDGALIAASYVCVIGSIAGVVMAVIPIDISRFVHLFFALIVFVSTLILNIFVFIYFLYVHHWTYLFFQILAISNMFTSLMYIITYFTHWYAPFWQKMSIITTSVAVYFYTYAFTHLII